MIPERQEKWLHELCSWQWFLPEGKSLDQSKEGNHKQSTVMTLIWRDKWELREVHVAEIMRANYRIIENYTENLVQKFAKVSSWAFGRVLIHKCKGKILQVHPQSNC